LQKTFIKLLATIVIYNYSYQMRFYKNILLAAYGNMGVCGSGTLLKQICAAQEAQESACLTVSEISAFMRTDGHG